MAAAIVLVLVARDAIVEGNFAGEAATGEKFKRAVDSGDSDAGISFLDEAVQFVGREMLVSFEEGSQDGAALSGLLKTDATQVPEENFLGFAHALARDTGLIVDAFL